MRPHVVWFGEAVPAIEEAARVVSEADIFVIIGTSMNVYPAAGLINYVPATSPIYVIDPNEVSIAGHPRIRVIQKSAGEGVQLLMEEIKNE